MFSLLIFFVSFCFCLDGKITINRENDVLVEAFDQSPLGIRFISFGTLEMGNMGYFYNCSAVKNDTIIIDDIIVVDDDENINKNKNVNDRVEIETANTPSIAKIGFLPTTSSTTNKNQNKYYENSANQFFFSSFPVKLIIACLFILVI